jgi:hypothetical protein
MKYKITKNGIDDYTLEYKDKKINFKSDVEIMTELQAVNEIAKQRMIIDLAKQGITLNELVKEVKKDGKTYFDNSNKDEMVKTYTKIIANELFNKAVEKMLGMSLSKLSAEIGIETKEEAEKLSSNLGEILVGRFQG